MPCLRASLHDLRTSRAARRPRREAGWDTGGLIKACEKRRVTIDELESAVEEIVNELTADNLREIPSRIIGPKVMAHLQKIDPVAFVRYASVYRQFQDVGEFSEVIESLESAPMDKLLQPDLFESRS